MEIVFRVDASNKLGTGHVMRCLTLANFLKEKRAKVAFVCAEKTGNLIDYIKIQGFRVYEIKENLNYLLDANELVESLRDLKLDILIIDHYEIDIRWEQHVKKALDTPIIMVIDDLANRSHDCDVLLDQNYFHEYESRYDGLVPNECTKLLGPNYLLLRPEFYEVEKKARDGVVKDLLIFYGGSDPTDETTKALVALEQIDMTNINVHVVVGSVNCKISEIKKCCEERNYFFYEQINYLAQLMAKADLSLGAGGVTMWERCFLGLPSIVTIVANNQVSSTEAAAEFGAVWNMGWHEHVKIADLVDIMNKVLTQPKDFIEFGHKAKQLMQSEQKQQTHPVVEAILEVLE